MSNPAGVSYDLFLPSEEIRMFVYSYVEWYPHSRDYKVWLPELPFDPLYHAFLH